MARTCPVLLAVISVVMITGCGPSLLRVSGDVTYQGDPLKQGTITFEPPGGGHRASGKIVDGKIVEITTFRAGDGIVPGTYSVAIQAVENADDMYAEHKSLIPEKYGNPQESGLTAEVTAGGPNDLLFKLEK